MKRIISVWVYVFSVSVMIKAEVYRVTDFNVFPDEVKVNPGRGTKGMGYIGKYRLKDVPETIGDYPEFHMFGELPAWAFYVRHADGLNLRRDCKEACGKLPRCRDT